MLEQLEKEEKIKEKAKEEELVEVPVEKKEEELKEMELKAKRVREMPGGGEKKEVEKEEKKSF